MNKLLAWFTPENDRKRKFIAIAFTLVISLLFTVMCIYWWGDYGFALFVITPLFMGICPVIIYGKKKSITRAQAFNVAALTLLFYCLTLVFLAIEGVICIIMALPLGLIVVWLGSVIGYEIIKRKPNSGTPTLITLLFIIPIFSFVEKDSRPSVTSVTTSIDIDANPSVVWKNVVEFPQLNEPTEFIFKTGIAYPINAKIHGNGVGAIRYCNFTTGSFVEPITVWDQPKLLSFDVLEQPEPMKEISFWDIDAPHLHDYFVSKKGQFRLIPLPNGKTRLEGTTWYYHRIKPEFYWRMWSNYIVHSIHNRVLEHIKTNSEKN
ncbi:hypothetical protein [Fluviicola sp.]|uniref:hypothetical protein n=1 Tax=Fluviicola sp. TaxID=1917219 RepID=UPI0031E2349A